MNESNDRMVAYLLGDLPDEAASQLEREFFSDQQMFDRLVQAETELVDAYVRGRLTGRPRERFEQHYLASERRRQRAKFAAALAAEIDRRRADPSEGRRPPAGMRANDRGRTFAFALAAAVVFLAAGAGLLLIQTSRLRSERGRTEAARADAERLRGELEAERARAAQLAADLARAVTRAPAGTPPASSVPEAAGPRRGVAPPIVAALTLIAPTVREPDTAIPHALHIPHGADRVRLQVIVGDNDYRTYEVSVKPVGGADVLLRRGVSTSAAPEGRAVTVTIPAAALTAGDYLVTVRGEISPNERDDVASLLFRVERN